MHWSALALDHLSQVENPSFALDFIAWDPFSQRVNDSLEPLAASRLDLALSLRKKIEGIFGKTMELQ